jgi:hypothetical protein
MTLSSLTDIHAVLIVAYESLRWYHKQPDPLLEKLVVIQRSIIGVEQHLYLWLHTDTTGTPVCLGGLEVSADDEGLVWYRRVGDRTKYGIAESMN